MCNNEYLQYPTYEGQASYQLCSHKREWEGLKLSEESASYTPTVL